LLVSSLVFRLYLVYVCCAFSSMLVQLVVRMCYPISTHLFFFPSHYSRFRALPRRMTSLVSLPFRCFFLSLANFTSSLPGSRGFSDDGIQKLGPVVFFRYLAFEHTLSSSSSRVFSTIFQGTSYSCDWIRSRMGSTRHVHSTLLTYNSSDLGFMFHRVLMLRISYSSKTD